MTSGERVTGRLFPWFIVVAVLVAALNLRAPLLSISPVIRDIERDLGVDAAAVSLLTTLPVLMFAAVTPISALVIRRAGAELVLLTCLIGVGAGTLIRFLPGFGWMLTGTVVLGVGIALGNIVVPVIIARDVPPGRVALVTAAYAAVMNAGSLITTLSTAPLAELTGWPVALVAWVLVVAFATALWGLHMWRGRIPGQSWADRYSGERPGSARSAREAASITGPMPLVSRPGAVLRLPAVWLLTITFVFQSASYYGISTWLPSLLGDTIGANESVAGALASVFQGVAVVGAFLVPLLTRFLPLFVPASVVAACWITLSAGLLLAPELFLLWVTIGAVGQAGGFVVIMTAVVGIARSDGEAATMSALVQGGGYVVAAFAAPFIGLLHDVSDGWTVPLLATLCFAVGFAVCGITGVSFARRPRPF